ncbi:glycosyltransferase family 1 protein [Bosea sp. BIWAKO-01]|uniref:glycosyltransferase family 4 protein n=1 Tax=Bosea sp. BIWAKO-01 TaxID=506668 RepID=UPI00086B3E84|nr:glycosyltransferase family 1 protein [Bosea sp. BIWAKO-01]GAU82900.1 glycosyltransferase [Bosea sp. BIWAKO-01]
MPTKILLEAHSLTLKRGTGIATYSRNLGKAAEQAGCSVELLMGVDRKINRRDPLLAEIGLHDANQQQGFAPFRAAARARDWAIGVPGGAGTVPMPGHRIVIDPASGLLSGTDYPAHAVERLEERAFLHFNRYGRRMTIAHRGRYDIFHATRPIPLALPKTPNIYTIHDIVPLRLPHSTLDNKRYFYRVMKELLRSADHIVTVSEFTKRDVMDIFGVEEGRITNTWQSVSVKQAILERSDEDVARAVELQYDLGFKDYYLFLGAIEPKKNISRMVDAYSASGSKRPLVLVGGLGWQYDRDLETLNDERFAGWRFDGARIKSDRRVRRLPYVPMDTLYALIRGARAVLFPSLYEGFGLPVLEAMLLGTPTITSNTSSLPEVAGDAAILVDPYRPDAIRDAIRAVDSDDALCTELARRGREQAALFSPERHAERIKAVYERVR